MLMRMIETGGPIVYQQELNDPRGFKVDLNDKNKCFAWLRGMRIYISGSMANCMDTYKDIFQRKAQQLTDLGAIVVNPATLPIGLADRSYMPICLSMLDGVDAIFLFNDWEHSKGANLERAYADYQGKIMLYEINYRS